MKRLVGIEFTTTNQAGDGDDGDSEVVDSVSVNVSLKSRLQDILVCFFEVNPGEYVLCFTTFSHTRCLSSSV